MKQGLDSLQAFATTVVERAARKDDLIVPGPRLMMLNGSELSVPTEEPGIGQRFAEYRISDVAHRQIGTHLSIPAKFYDRLRLAVDGEGAPDEALRQLLDRNVNTLLGRSPSKRLLRTYRPTDDEGGFLRAMLSDHYMPRDDDELLAHVAPILMGLPGAKLASCDLTETHFYLKVVTERLEGEVKRGDFVQAGVQIRNSEVGHGSLSIRPFIYRLECTNGMVVPVYGENGASYRHVGTKLVADTNGRRYSDETLRKTDEAFFAQVAEDVKAAVDETAFQSILVQMRAAAETKQIDDPAAAVERLSQRFSLTDGEGAEVLKQLALGGDLTAYGALNAITRIAQDASSYDRATELETLGGQVLAITPREWEVIAS